MLSGVCAGFKYLSPPASFAHWCEFWVFSSWWGLLSAHAQIWKKAPVAHSKTTQNITVCGPFCSVCQRFPKVPSKNILSFIFSWVLTFWHCYFDLFVCKLFSINILIWGLQENGWFRLHCTQCPIRWLLGVTTSMYPSVYTKGPSQCPSSTLAWQLQVFSVKLLDQDGLWNTWFKRVL